MNELITQLALVFSSVFFGVWVALRLTPSGKNDEKYDKKTARKDIEEIHEKTIKQLDHLDATMDDRLRTLVDFHDAGSSTGSGKSESHVHDGARAATGDGLRLPTGQNQSDRLRSISDRIRPF